MKKAKPPMKTKNKKIKKAMKNNIQIIKSFFNACKGKSFTLPNGEVVEFDNIPLTVHTEEFIEDISAKRLRRSTKQSALACCSWDVLKKTNDIYFAKAYLIACKDTAKLVDTCIHELGHAVCFFTGVGRDHDATWETVTKELYAVLKKDKRTCKRCDTTGGDFAVLFSVLKDASKRKETFHLVKSSMLDGSKEERWSIKGIDESMEKYNEFFDNFPVSFVRSYRLDNRRPLKLQEIVEAFQSENKGIVYTLENKLGEQETYFVPTVAFSEQDILLAAMTVELEEERQAQEKKPAAKKQPKEQATQLTLAM